jgi:phosphohistidine phosphatase
MKLLLVQHGHARTEAEDPERSLNITGIESAKKVAKWLSVSGVKVTEILHSGKRRAEQTSEIFAGHLSPSKGFRSTSGLNPKDDVSLLADELKGYSGSLMLVGHLPVLSRLTGLLVAGDPECEVVKFQNAGVVCLVEYEGRWGIEWMIVPDLIKK